MGTENESARLKAARTRLDKLDKDRSELIGELKYLDQSLSELTGSADPKEIERWIKSKSQELSKMETRMEELLTELEEVLDEIEDR